MTATITGRKRRKKKQEKVSELEMEADLYWRSERWEQAAACYRQLVKLSPHEPRYWFLLGYAYQKIGDSQQAYACYAQEKRLDYIYLQRVIDYYRQRLNRLNESHYPIDPFCLICTVLLDEPKPGRLSPTLKQDISPDIVGPFAA